MYSRSAERHGKMRIALPALTAVANMSKVLLVPSRLAVPDKGVDEVNGAANSRTFQFETPTRFSGHQCPQHDQWGVYGYNDQYYEALGGACIPRDIWNQPKYQFSDPDAWLYDVNNFNGWGHHPD